MELDAKGLSAEAAYKLLTGCVVPRPIAWITSRSSAGLVNLAPFSAFTFVSNRPPMVAVSIGRKAGVLKDTARNIFDRREFVINIADLTHLDALHRSAIEYPESVSEATELRIELAESRRIGTPRIKDAPVSLECRLHQVLEFGDFRTNLIVGEVLLFHIRDSLIRDGKIDTRELRPICRIGGPNYASLGEIVTLQPLAVTPK